MRHFFTPKFHNFINFVNLLLNNTKMVSLQKSNLQRVLYGISDGTFRSARHAAKAIENIYYSTITRNFKRRTVTERSAI